MSLSTLTPYGMCCVELFADDAGGCVAVCDDGLPYLELYVEISRMTRLIENGPGCVLLEPPQDFERSC